MTRRWRGLAAIAAAALALTGCSAKPGGSAATNSSGPAGTLQLGMLAAPSTLAAIDAYWSNEAPYLQAVYDSLLHMKPDGSHAPNLASEWSYNPEQTVLTLKLRSGITFSDGQPFNADAAAKNLLRFRDGTSPSANLFRSVADVAAVDDKTVEIRLSERNPALLNLLSQNGGLMQSPATFDNPDSKNNPVGTGPYTLNTAETVIGTSYTFDAKANYWNPDNVHYKKIVMKVFEDPTALLNAIKGKQVNAANLTSNQILEEVQAAGFGTVTGSVNFLGLLLWDRAGKLTPALGDKRVRQAINYAIDADAMFKAMTQGVGERTGQIFPPTSPGYDAKLDTYYTYNPDKARQLMAEAGYKDGFTLKVQNRLFPESAHALYAQQLGAIGIKVEFTDPGANIFADMMGGKFSASVFMQGQDIVDWQLSQFLLTKNAPWNPFKYEDSTVEKLTTVLRDGDKKEADEAAKELNRYIVEQAWFNPWYRPQATFVVDATTTATFQTGQVHPNLWTIQPR
ncbi:ABC transporter substrate-binding protein [Nonomuraea sp. NPDC050328]|uniref:ABC transporter substrate-binding protein n=1 Tax=Nonomuraea sp. NPDC050328 TaxID=3364361 RepID=UPI0037AC89FD